LLGRTARHEALRDIADGLVLPGDQHPAGLRADVLDERRFVALAERDVRSEFQLRGERRDRLQRSPALAARIAFRIRPCARLGRVDVCRRGKIGTDEAAARRRELSGNDLTEWIVLTGSNRRAGPNS
jgi:hypothetical protein